MHVLDGRARNTPDAFPLLLAIAAVAVVALPRPASAGAWAQEDKGVYLKASAAYSYADEQYKAEGEKLQLLSTNEEGTLESRAVRFYGEFGLLPRLTFLTSTSIVRNTVDSRLVNITTTGMGDFRAGLKYQFLDDPVVVSLASVWTLPTGYTAQPENPKVPTLGLGVPMHTATLAVGKSFYPVPLYASAEVGFRVRGGRELSNGDRLEYPPELPYALEVGVDATDWLMVRGALRGLHGFGDPEELNVFTLSPRTQSYLKVGPSVLFTVAERVQIQLDYMYTPVGVNALRSHEFTAGTALDYTF